MRRIAVTSISIALVACSGCASVRHQEAQEPQAKTSDTLPPSRPDLSRALHGLYDWAER